MGFSASGTDEEWDIIPKDKGKQIADDEIKKIVSKYLSTPLPLANLMIMSSDSDFLNQYNDMQD